MRITLSSVKTELIWVGAIVLFELALVIVFFGVDAIQTNKMDYQVHDSYVIMNTWWVIVQLALVSYTLLSPARILFGSRSRLSNILIYLSSISTILIATLLFLRSDYLGLIWVPESTGWTVYPPLSEIPDVVQLDADTVNYHLSALSWGLLLIQCYAFGTSLLAAALPIRSKK